MTDPLPLRERLLAEIAEVPYEPLAAHVSRGGLFLVEASLDLVTVAVAIGENRTAEVEALVATGGLRRPTAAEVERFSGEPAAYTFRFVIVQPFVLAQVMD